ncbi:MAG: YggS family pyridoxal phosphate-dependent enzyme [archaeon]
MIIGKNVKRILGELPLDICLVAVTKTRNVLQIKEAIDSGVKIIGENYVNEAAEKFDEIGLYTKWHMIGHLQKNKVKDAARIFDMIESLDSSELAKKLNSECKKISKVMEVLIEINSANEAEKTGVLIQDVQNLAKEISNLGNLKLRGLMTLGPSAANPEVCRQYFIKTRELFKKLKSLYGDDFNLLSMGMSDTYKIGIEEGANIVRIGTAIFGPRN